MCACYRPLRIFYTGRKTENGKKEGILTNGFERAISFERAERKIKGLKLGDCKGIKFVSNHPFLTMYDDIPCGRCIGCKLDYSRDWATRCDLEARKYGENNAFLTLTYDDEHLPKDRKLNKKHMQDFLKRLRWFYGNGIRVAYCGELGGITKRPHYHALIMNIQINDKKKWDNTLCTSERISKIWGMGNVLIGKVTYESAAYVARYVLKKSKDDEAFFITSRRPGLANDYLVKNGQIFANGKIYAYSEKGIHFSIPKYFKRKLEEQDQETAEYLKERNKRWGEGKDIQKLEAYPGYDSIEKVLKMEEEMQEHRQKRLRRSLNE